MVKILHLIKTKTIASDGRLLKWVDSLEKEKFTSEIFVLQDENKKGNFYYKNTLVYTTTLFFRRFFKKSRGFLFKVPEFTIKELIFVLRRRYDIYVFHDVQHYLVLFVLCLFKSFHRKRIVWDLHELPHAVFIKFKVSRWIVRFILNKSDFLIYTNEDRRRYILNHFKHQEKEFAILNNFPSESYLFAKKAEMPLDLEKWLNGFPYVLWMGMASHNRNFIEFVEGMLPYKDRIRVVVMGAIEPGVKEYCIREGITDLIFSKFVPQGEIQKYVDNSLFSVVLYNASSANNYYCEPNRLYQLITRGVPVIVGYNPPMKSLVTLMGSGIVLDDDGTDEEGVANAVRLMMESTYRSKITEKLKATDYRNLTWESQFPTIVEKLIEIR